MLRTTYLCCVTILLLLFSSCKHDLKTCETSTDCEIGLNCFSGLCLNQSCIKNSDCKSGESCTDGKCVVPTLTPDGKKSCSVQSDCAVGEECKTNVCQGRGFKELKCTGDTDCPTGEFCIQSICKVKPCYSDFNCNPGYECVSKQCVKKELNYASYNHGKGILSIVDVSDLTSCSYSEDNLKRPQRATKQIFAVLPFKERFQCPNKAGSISIECKSYDDIAYAADSDIACATLRQFDKQGNEIYSYSAVEGVVSSRFDAHTSSCILDIELKFSNGVKIKKNYNLLRSNFQSTACGEEKK